MQQHLAVIFCSARRCHFVCYAFLLKRFSVQTRKSFSGPANSKTSVNSLLFRILSRAQGWSVLGLKWEGISFKHVSNMVEPKKTAKFVSFECADGYTTSLSLQELTGDDILLAYKLDEEYLEEGIGAPLRLVVPDKYGYKSAMWITRIKFTAIKETGYWERRGYSDTADVWRNDRFSS